MAETFMFNFEKAEETFQENAEPGVPSDTDKPGNVAAEDTADPAGSTTQNCEQDPTLFVYFDLG